MRIMDPKTLVYLLVCMWYSLNANKSAVATAQGTLCAEILTPESDCKEGGEVQMKCNATNFDFQIYILEWQKDGISLRRGKETLTTVQRLTFPTAQEMNTSMVYIEELTITGVQREDSGNYTCNVIYNASGTNGTNIVATATVTLSVLYFPSESFPICSPAGPITAVAGIELNIQCSSEVGNPRVVIFVFQLHNNASTFIWSAESRTGDTISKSLEVTANIANNNAQFLCFVTSTLFPRTNRSCNIGPITVGNVTESPIAPDTTPQNNNKTTEAPVPGTNLATIIASTVAAGVVVIIIIILIILYRRRYSFFKKKQSSEDNIVITNPSSTKSPQDKRVNSSQPNVHNEEGGLEKHDTQSSEADEDTGPVPGRTGHHYSTTFPRRAEEPESGLIYAKPQKATVLHDSDSGVKSTTEQTYTNPSFDFKINDETTRPFDDYPTTSVDPVAKVQPNTNVPRKPAPYRSKLAHTSNAVPKQKTLSADLTPDAIQTGNYDGVPTQDVQPNKNVPRKPAPYKPKSDRMECHPRDSQIPLLPLSPADPNIEARSACYGGDTSQETSSPHSDVTYAQVSVPIRQNSSSSQRPGDDVAYAELDLTSQTSQDDGVKPSSSAVGPAIYATVTKTK